MLLPFQQAPTLKLAFNGETNGEYSNSEISAEKFPLEIEWNDQNKPPRPSIGDRIRLEYIGSGKYRHCTL